MKRSRRMPMMLRTALVFSLVTVMFLLCAECVCAASVKNADAYVNTSGGAHLRLSATTDSKSLGVIKDGSRILVTKEVFKKKSSTKPTDIWYKVEANNKVGYIRSDLVDGLGYYGMQGKIKSTVNYRVGPGTGMAKKGKFKKGTMVDVVGKANRTGSGEVWYKIRKGSEYCYVNSKRISLTGKATELPNIQIVLGSVKKPTKLGVGIPFAASAEISAEKPMSKVVAGIVNDKDKFVQSVAYDIAATDENDAKTFSLTEEKTSGLKFHALEVGTYKYRINVYVDGTCYTKLDSEFAVFQTKGPEKIVKSAVNLAWPKGTDSSKYSYSGGKATEAFTKALDKYYPEHTKWSAGPKTGASCDVFVGTAVRASGYDPEMTRGLGNDTTGDWYHLRNSSKWVEIPYSYKESELRSGDLIIYKKTSGGHILVYCKENGKGFIAEAGYKKTYGHINSSVSKILKVGNKTDIAVFRATE